MFFYLYLYRTRRASSSTSSSSDDDDDRDDDNDKETTSLGGADISRKRRHHDDDSYSSSTSYSSQSDTGDDEAQRATSSDSDTNNDRESDSEEDDLMLVNFLDSTDYDEAEDDVVFNSKTASQKLSILKFSADAPPSSSVRREEKSDIVKEGVKSVLDRDDPLSIEKDEVAGVKAVLKPPQYLMYLHRGEVLAEYSLYEYVGIISVVKKTEKDSSSSKKVGGKGDGGRDDDDNGDDSEDGNDDDDDDDDDDDGFRDRDARDNKPPALCTRSRRKRNLRLPFALFEEKPIPNIHTDHVQMIRSRQLIPILAGSGPPIFPGAQPEVISGDPKSKRSHDNWLRKANAFGSFVVAVYCPWDITSGMPPYELSWKGLQEWIKTELLESKHFVDQARVKWIRNVATGFTVDKRVLKLIAEWRGRSATRWSKEPGSKDDALQYGSEGLLYKGREGSGAHIEDDAAYLEANLMLQFILMQDLKKGTAAGAKLDSDLLSSLDPSSVAIAQDKKSEQKRKDREVLNQSLEWLQTLHEPYKEFAAPSSSSPLSAEEVNRGLLNRDDDDPATIEEGGDTRNKVLTSGKLWQREQVFLLPHSTKTSVKEMRATLGAIDKDEKKYMRPTGATAVTNNHGNNNKSGEDRKTSDVDDGSSRDGSSSGGRFMSSATLHNRLLLGESGGFTMNSGNRSMSSSSLQQQPAKPLPWFFTIFPTRDLITAKLRASSDYSRPFLELSQEQLIVVEKILVWLHKDYCFQQKQQQLSMMPLPSTTSSKMFTRQDASKLMSKEINTKSDITPLCLSVHGGPGSGKSTALNALLKLLKDCNAESLLRIATPTGIAATAISSGATTIHRLFGWIPGTANYRGAALKNKDQMDRFVQTFEGVRLIIIDEMSMISQEDLFQINCALQGAYGGIKGTTSVGNEPVGVEGLAGSEQDLFGGLGIVLTGDFFQLPCVGGTPLYKPARKTSLNYYDNFQVLMFNQQQRAAKDMSHSTALEKLRDISDTTTPLAKHEFILSSIRPISSDDLRDILTYEDYHKQSHDALSPSSSYEDYLLSLWHFAPIVTPSNENVFAFNLHQVCRFAKMSGKPVLAFQLPLRGEQVKEILGSNSKIKGSLYAKFPQLWFYFVPGAPARINVNICVQLGIANGTPCRLVSVILSNDADRDQAHQAYMNAKPGDIVRLEYTPEAMCVAVELNDTMNHLSTAATTEDVQDSSAPLFATNSTTTVVDSFSRPFLTKTKVQTIIDHNKKSTSSLVNATAGSRNNAKDIFFVRHHHHTQQRHSTTTASKYLIIENEQLILHIYIFILHTYIHDVHVHLI